MSLTSSTTINVRNRTTAILANPVIKPRLGKVLAGKCSQIRLTESCQFESISRSEFTCGQPHPTLDLLWKRLVEKLRLYRNEIHLWRADLDQHNADMHPLSTILSSAECERAAHYHFEKDRRRFIVRRALLRMILSHYLTIQPERLKFTYGRCGKPALAGPQGDNLQFNVSHSDGLALFAVTLDGAIGVDVERIRVIPEADQIGTRYFSPLEMAAWRSLPHTEQPEAFLRLWASKEASLKLSGRGLFDLTERIPSGSEAKALDDASVWPRFSVMQTECALCQLTPAPGYVGALTLTVPEVERSKIV